MATRNNQRIAAAIGTIGPDHLQTLLADGRFTQAQVAYIASTSPSRLAKLLAEPVPEPLAPRNWSLTADFTYFRPPFVPVDLGLSFIAWPYPRGGFTYGTPIPTLADGT